MSQDALMTKVWRKSINDQSMDIMETTLRTDTHIHEWMEQTHRRTHARADTCINGQHKNHNISGIA